MLRNDNDESMQRLIAGVLRFQGEIDPSRQGSYRRAAREGKSPHTLFITCSELAMEPEVITQSGAGEIVVFRNIGNLVPAYRKRYDCVSATIEHAVVALEVQHIVVCGHSPCAAMTGLLQPEHVERLPITTSWLRNGEPALRMVRNCSVAADESARLEELIEENVLLQMHNLRTHPCVGGRLADRSLAISGWVYDGAQGMIRAFDHEKRKFMPLSGADNFRADGDCEMGHHGEILLQPSESKLETIA